MKPVPRGEDAIFSLLEGGLIPVQSLDKKGKILNVSRAWLDRLGYSRDEVIGRHFIEFVPPEDRTRLEKMFKRFWKTGEVQCGEIRLVARDGNIREFVHDGMLVKGSQDEPECTFCILRDVTEERRMQRVLEEREKRYRLLVEHAQDVIFRYELLPERRWAYVSPSAERVMGYSPEEFYRDPMLGFGELHEVDRQKAAEILSGKMEGIPVRMRWNRKDGKQFWIEVRATALRDDEGRVVAIEGVGRDITRQVEAEEEKCRVEKALRLLTSVNQAILRARDVDALIEEVCRIFIVEGGYTLAWTGFIDPERKNRIHLRAYCGEKSDFITWLKMASDRGKKHLYQMPIIEKEIVVISDIASMDYAPEWRNVALDAGLRSCVMIPLKNGGRPFAILCAASSSPKTLNDEENELLREIALNVSQGILQIWESEEKEKLRRALSETDARIRTLLEMLPEVVFEVDAEGRIVFVNENAFRVFGYEKEDLEKGLSIFQMIAPEEKERVRRDVGEAMKRTTQKSARYTAVRKDGSRFPMLVYAKAIFVDGRPEGMRGIIIDLTELERVEQALKKSEARFRRIVETANEGILEMDREFRITYVNTEVTRIFGYTEEELLGRSIFEFLPQEEIEDQTRECRRRENGFASRFERRVRCRDGSLKWILVSATPILGEKGEFLGSFGMLLDVTERHEAEERLREREKRLAQIIEHLPDATLAIDREGKVIAWNSAIEEMTGVKAEEMLGKGNYEYAIPFYGERRPILVDLIFAPDDEIKKRYRITRREGRTLMAETTLPVVKGEKRVLWGKATPLYDEKGEVVGAVESIRDLTLQREMEQKLKESEALYRTIFENTGTAMAIIEDDTTISLANQQFSELVGYPLDEIEGKMSWTRFVVKEDLEFMLEQHRLRQIAPDKAKKQYFFRSVRRNGEIRELSLVAAMLPGTKKSVVSLIDVTEQRRAERALAERETLYRTLAENAPFMIWLVNYDGFVEYVNQLAAERFHMSPAEMKGKHLSELFPPETAEKHLDSIRRVLDRWEPLSHVIEDRFADGICWTDVTIVPLKCGTDAKKRVMGITIDITKRIEMEHRIRESEAKFRNLFENAGDAIFLCEVEEQGKSTSIIEANTAACAMLGFNREELVGRSIRDLESPEFREKTSDAMKGLDCTCHALYETEFLRRNRTRIPVELSMHLFTLGEKRVALSIARDITERKISQQIEKEAFAQIEKNILQLSILNDHIRNPLAVIVALADMEGGKTMEKILAQAKEIDRIITQLDMAWLESEKIREFLRKHYGFGEKEVV